MMFQEFKESLLDFGATALDKGGGHWQVKVGPVTINFYPNSKRRTIFINGVKGITSTRRYQNADIYTIKSLVQEFKEQLTKESSNDTSTTSNSNIS